MRSKDVSLTPEAQLLEVGMAGEILDGIGDAADSGRRLLQSYGGCLLERIEPAAYQREAALEQVLDLTFVVQAGQCHTGGTEEWPGGVADDVAQSERHHSGIEVPSRKFGGRGMPERFHELMVHDMLERRRSLGDALELAIAEEQQIEAWACDLC